MKLQTKTLTLIVMFMFIFGFSKPSTPLTLRELLEKAKELDNSSIIFVGEAIGQRLNFGSNVWVNVLDKEGNAIGVWMNKKVSERIIYFGDNKTSGDILYLEGIFHKACLEHGGDTDIHLTKFSIIESGKRRLALPINQFFFYAIPFLTILTLYFYYKKRRNVSLNDIS